MTILADSVDVVIGVDPHKHTHTAAIVAADTGKHHASRTTSADPNGFADLLGFATAHDGSRCWVIRLRQLGPGTGHLAPGQWRRRPRDRQPPTARPTDGKEDGRPRRPPRRP